MEKNSRGWKIVQMANEANRKALKNVENECSSVNDPGEGTSKLFEINEEFQYNDENDNDFSSDDAIKDQNYVPSEDSDEEENIMPTPTVKFKDQNYVPSEDSDEEENFVPTPTVKSLSRLRKAYPSKWKRQMNRDLKSKCLSYYDYKGNLKDAKKPKKLENHKCKFNCSNFDEDSRMKLCKNFNILPYTEKKNFILQNVEALSPQSRRPRSESGIQRKLARKYFFIHNSKKKRVCQQFFLGTLNISNRSVIQAFLGKNEFGGHYSIEDKRGKHIPKNKTSTHSVNIVKQHIESFPVVESHYCRQTSKRKYLDSNLSIKKMYHLYKNNCLEVNENVVSEITYRRIFCKDFNLSFFIPKKDQCLICHQYKIASENQKMLLQESYENHLKRKIEAYNEKLADKKKADLESNFKSISMDMQSVLQIPSTDVSLTYYKRKLILHNFTIYEQDLPNKAFCFAWTEINGKRGSCEVGSCLLKYIMLLPQNVKELSIFSDSCGGQNRNLQISALLLNLVQITQLDIIEQKFMESGHSYMEVDSMHSAIEKQKRFMSIYCVNDWINVFKTARRNKSPYQVTEMKFDDFYDLKKLSNNINCINCETGEKVSWLKVKCFRYEKNKPFILQYKYNFSESFKAINVLDKPRGRPLPVTSIKNTNDIPKLYKKTIPISSAKKKDLLELCKKGVIPEIFHSWFLSLPSTESLKDMLPEPNFDENSDDSD